MSYTIVPIAKNDLTAAFSLYKTSLFEFINQAFGWDEIFQQDRFAASYPVDTLQWIVMDGVVKGLWCVSDKIAELHLHLVLLYPKQ